MTYAVSKSFKGLVLAIALFASAAINQSFSQSITKPSQHFGFEPGADGMLFTYEKMIDYFKILEGESGRLKTFQIGETSFGRPLYLICISSEANIQNIESLKAINAKLALDYELTQQEVDRLKVEGKVFVLGTLSMHSNEVAPAQASPTIAYKLLSSTGKDTLAWLDNVVYMMVACHNPDGMNMVVENYMKNKGTKFEGTNLPGIYHKYAGHNINRDFVTLNMPENKAVSGLTSKEWFPQVMVEKHQMGSTGARYFVPPNHDPIAQNIDESLWSWIGLFGANMLNDMTALGQKGISQRYIFDNYWPGSTETCLWKNVISMLTESASVKTATPIYIEKNELKVWGKGISEYKKGSNFIAPWEGGWWRLGDLVAYELSSTFSMLKTASVNKDQILQHRNDICKKEYAKGLNEPPLYYVLPADQHDRSELARLISLLQEHGVTVNSLTSDITIEKRVYHQGDFVVSLAQPFRAFIKEVMEKQTYPERRYIPGGEIIKPYDITSWSLPISMGVEAHEIITRSPQFEQNMVAVSNISLNQNLRGDGKYIILDAANNESYGAAFTALAKGVKVRRTTQEIEVDGRKHLAGSFVIQSENRGILSSLKLYVNPIETNDVNQNQLVDVKLPSIALVETWFHDMDAGWTRYIFDIYSIPYKVIRPSDLADPNALKNIQLLILPDQNAELLMQGKRKRQDEYYPLNLPPDFTKGMGKKGKDNLLKFIDGGGKVISWGQSTELFMGMQDVEIDKEKKDEFTLPVQNVGKNLAKSGLEVFEAHVKVDALANHPLTYGMPKSFAILFDAEIVFETSIPSFDTDRRVILSFPTGNVGVSGYVSKGELLENKAAMVWVRKNKGQLILLAFSPQFRASTPATYKLIFNSLLAE